MSPSLSSQAPLRLAIIGLSASAVTSWAATGHLPYLLSPSGQKRYTITALLNSSVAAAKAAIKQYDLSPSTKAYGNPQDLANDPDIDVVICNTRVDKHLETILPSIEAGKDIYVEWPVASDLKDTETIWQAAKKSGSRVAVGVQARWAPPVAKIQQILAEGKVGKVLSSEVHSWGGSQMESDVLGPGWEYFADRKVGGNHVSILFGHLIDTVQHILGPLEQNSTVSQSQVQWPTIRIIDTAEDPKKVLAKIPADTPDLFYLTGKLSPSPLTTPNALLSASYHRAWPAFPSDPTLLWTITCAHATIRLRAWDYPSLQADAYGKPVLLDIHWTSSSTVEQIDWDWEEAVRELPVRGRNTGRCLEAFATGQDDGWADLEGTVRLAGQLEGWLEEGRW